MVESLEPKLTAIRTLVALVARFGLAGLVNTGIGFAITAGLAAYTLAVFLAQRVWVFRAAG